MFGYVRPVKEKLTDEQRERYEAAYCGLCHAMGRRYGVLARFFLTYDFVFLAMLLSDPEEVPDITRKRCPLHPFCRKKGCMCFDGLDTAADKSVILTWHKLRDDVEDKGFLRGLPARLTSLTLKRAYRRASVLQPGFDRQVRESLAVLSRLEEERSPSIDRTADAFATILKGAVGDETETAHSRVLGQLLYHVGRWIYLTDAWDDLEEDRKQGSYNPLFTRFAGCPEAHMDELRTTMTHSLRLAISAYHLTDLGVYGAVIENILFLGLPTVQEAVLTGKWREMQRSGRKKHE